MDHQEAAQRIADVINEVRAAGFLVDMGDWPECMVSVSSPGTFATSTTLHVVHRDGGWTVKAP